MKASVGSLGILGVLLAGHLALAAPAQRVQAQPLKLFKNLPKDPLVVLSVSVEDPSRSLEVLLDFVGDFGASGQKEQVRRAVDTLNRSMRMSLQKDVLAHLGPEITIVLDVSPIDELVMAFQPFDQGTIAEVLGRVGLVAQVRDPKALDRSLRSLFENLGGEPVETENAGLVRFDTPIKVGDVGGQGAALLTVCYAIHEDKVAFGFSEIWVLEALGGLPESQQLAAGEDFARVFAQLDPNASRLLYVNLPRVRQLVDGSRLVQAVLASDDEVRGLFERFLSDKTMGVGIGSTSVAADGGVRTTNFGPDWLTKAISGAILAAQTVQD